MDDSAIFSRKHSGAYFTPADVARALVNWVVRQASDRLLDPSCGDGQFLAFHRNAIGVEQNPISAQAAMSSAPWAVVYNSDFFAWATETRERFECAAGNPPFIRYQNFSGTVRQRALDLCKAQGVDFTGLASSWAPFLVATAALLKPGGRLAFVVPAEIGHAPYAAPLLDFLVRKFSDVRIVAVRRKLFPSLSEDCWLLYADGYGSSTATIAFTECDVFTPDNSPPRATCMVDVEEWRTVWSRRLRPFLLPKTSRSIYAKALRDPGSRRFADFARVGIGYVSGANDFFHLRPSEAARWKIPKALLQPSLRSTRVMPKERVTQTLVDSWTRNDDKVLLLRLSRDTELPAGVRAYLDSNAGREARLGYKCRNRKPWYVVPDVQIPDVMLSYMSGRSVNLVLNEAGVTCTNSVHSVRLRDQALAQALLPQWHSPFVRLSCELEGHALGGGMLKLEPREAGRILFAPQSILAETDDETLSDAVRSLQRWRHYAD